MHNRYDCTGCGAYKHVFTGECEDCGCSICSVCCVEARNDAWSSASSGLCRKCAIRRLNQELAPLVPICVCSEVNASANAPWPDTVRYGQQLTITEAA
jgi:hypothetical protein